MDGIASQPATLKIAMQRYFEAALCLLLGIGFGTLAATGNLDLPTEILVGGALLLRGYGLWTQRSFLLPAVWTTALTLGCVAFYLADYFFLTGSFLKATVHLVLFVMLIRLFSAQRDRDYYFLGVLSFLMLLAAAALTVNATFLLGLAVFTLVAVVTVILMEMRHAAAIAAVCPQASDATSAPRSMASALSGASPAITVSILMVATIIFFLLPRDSAGYLSAYSANDSIGTGFSEQVRLGRIGEIQQSGAVVMHVQIDGDRFGGRELKWRGVALNLFDGQTWSNPRMLHALPRSPDGGFVVATGRHPLSSLQTIEYRVLLEPISSNVFFLAPTATEVRGNFRTVAGDGAGAAFNVDLERPLNAYNATSDLSTPEAAELRNAHGLAPPEILLDDLQLPHLDPRIPRLAEQITGGRTSNYDKAIALVSYLQTHFGYTLQLSRTPPRDPLADFLFVRKQGHCEYFASSMAVMLRTLRIPARVVNGFRGGEFNDVTSQYIIRARDAHSWVEAYFPAYGWVAFDPTPSGLAGAPTGWGRAALYLDALASFWREWVVNYDPAHQFALAENASRGSRQGFARAQQWARHTYEMLLNTARRSQEKMTRQPKRWGLGAALAILLVLLARYGATITRIILRWRQAARPGKSPSAAAAIWYERMIRRVEKRGFRKTPTQTPGEFVDGIGDAVLRTQITRFTEHYESARFGESAEHALRLPDLFAEIARK
jgi:transglutaminase-like putative cysteine protease